MSCPARCWRGTPPACAGGRSRGRGRDPARVSRAHEGATDDAYGAEYAVRRRAWMDDTHGEPSQCQGDAEGSEDARVRRRRAGSRRWRDTPCGAMGRRSEELGGGYEVGRCRLWIGLAGRYVFGELAAAGCQYADILPRVLTHPRCKSVTCMRLRYCIRNQKNLTWEELCEWELRSKFPFPPFFSLSSFTHATMGNVNGCYNRTVPLTCCHDLMISDS